MHKVYTYGTLRPGMTGPIHVPGTMYDLGWYPGVILPSEGMIDAPIVVVEAVTINDKTLAFLDDYEGYDPLSPETSLYVRKEFMDGWIYEYNRSVKGKPLVKGGDWFVHTNSARGRNSHYLFSFLQEA